MGKSTKICDFLKNYYGPLLAIIAIVISICSLRASHKSNLLSEESNNKADTSNEIAEKSYHLSETSIAISNMSQMQVNFISSSYEFVDMEVFFCNKDPNLDKKDFQKFTFEVALLFEIRNTGGKTNTFSNIDYNRAVHATDDLFRVVIDHAYWNSQSDFEEWLLAHENKIKSSKYSFENLRNAEVEGPTIVIKNGEAKRVLIKGKLVVYKYFDTSWEEFVSKIINVTWSHNINFIFIDKTIITVPFFLPNPFEFPDNFVINDFVSCN